MFINIKVLIYADPCGMPIHFGMAFRFIGISENHIDYLEEEILTIENLIFIL
jgi:hypothetical protein